MLNEEKLKEIKNLVESSQNPLFFFDNDVDGLCSFLVLQRAIGRGRGVAVKSFPELSKAYLKKVDELNPDMIFILDKPRVSKEFVSGIIEKNIPIIWIDHHDVQVQPEVLEKVEYFNSFPTAEPTTYICYKAAGRAQDDWLALIGCIGDVYMPDFAKKFAEKYPEIFDSKLSAFDSLFMTEIGKAVKMLNFGLKDTITNVVKMIKYLMKAKNVYDVLQENQFTKQLHYRYEKLNAIYSKLLNRALSNITGSKLVFFTYSGEMSMSSEISNEIYFNHKNKFVVVAYKGSEKANISIRGKNARKITLKALEGIENSTGGGHEEACGAQLPADKLDDFRKKIEELILN